MKRKKKNMKGKTSGSCLRVAFLALNADAFRAPGGSFGEAAFSDSNALLGRNIKNTGRSLESMMLLSVGPIERSTRRSSLKDGTSLRNTSFFHYLFELA